jgi:hypothetical protein
MTRFLAVRVAVLAMGLVGASGCAETIKQSAREAAPAAVEASVKEAHEPNNRERMAEILKDPEIREATASLAQAVMDGVLNSVSEPQRLDRIDRATEAFVSRIGTSFTLSLKKDMGPAISTLVADAVDRSVDRALNERTEQRMEAIALAVARGALSGMVVDPAAGSGTNAAATPALRRIAHDVAREAALGIEDAVQVSTRDQKSGRDTEGAVLAAAGKAADVAQGALPLVFWLVLGGAILVALGALLWVVLLLRRQRRMTSSPMSSERYVPDPQGSRVHG